MSDISNISNVILFSCNRSVINLCRRALESFCKIQVVESISQSILSLRVFSNPVIIDTESFTNAVAQLAGVSVKYSQFIFLVRRNNYLLEEYMMYSSCVPFPCDLEILRETVKSRFPFISDIQLLPMRRKHAIGNIDTSGFEQLIGSSEVITDVKRQLARVAAKELTVLLLGESGTGKTLAAKLIHNNSCRRSKNFISVDMATVVEGLAESDLFGTVPGAYTGAVRRAGKFARADGGTLFLDEIGEVPLSLQPKLLRVIETGNYCNVGSDIEHHVDIRLICATNENLPRSVREGRFRSDLYYRMEDYTIVMPPLRKRLGDIKAIVDFFLAGKNKELSDSALAKLMQYDWPGNIRQLKNCLRRAWIMSKDEVIQSEFINY